MIIELFDEGKNPVGECRFSIHNLLSGPKDYQGSFTTNKENLELRHRYNVSAKCERTVYCEFSQIMKCSEIKEIMYFLFSV